MVWSNWSGAAVVMLACVGATWGQTPVPTSAVAKGPGTLTIHENGASIRCRVITSWTTQDGSKAYQLQTLDNGEMITIVEDGPATTLREPLLAGKVKSLPMRIFHWGNNRVPPPGVPIAPETVVVTTGATITATTTMNQGSASKDQVIWWEEKNGKRASPVIVTNGNNPFVEKGSILTIPRSNEPVPMIVDQKSSGVPAITDRGTPSYGANVQIVSTMPGPSGPVTSVPLSPNAATDSSLTRTVPATPASAYESGSRPDAHEPVTTTAAAAASNGMPAATPVPAPRPTVWEKIGNIFHPKRDTNPAAQATDAKSPTSADKSKAPAGSVPFSTARLENQSGDILLSPEKFDPSGAKLTPRGINMGAYRGDPNQLMTPPQAAALAQNGPSQTPYLPAPPYLPGDGRMPPGAQSVLAAGSNAPTNVTYVPVPMATVPDMSRPPLPPEPPRPNAYGSNAFTPPPPLPNNQGQNPMMANAYGTMSPQANAYPPAQRNPQVPGGNQAYLPNPDPAKAQQLVQPIQYNPPPVPTPAANPAMDRRQAPAAGTPGPELGQIIQVLRESPYPAQREWAANTLGTYDTRSRPDVVQLLLALAQQDPAATVRAACVYSLGRTKSPSEPVLNALYTLRNDGDPRVRDEAERALVRLGVANKR